MAVPDSCPPGVSSGREFRTTCWERVRIAAGDDASAAEGARDSLCRQYWYPLYAYLRRTGYPPPEAQDLIQGFFASLLKTNELGAADPRRGRFRSFLIGTLKHFLSDEGKRSRAQKRGGSCVTVSWDVEASELRYRSDSVDPAAPDVWFDRQWAFELLRRVLLQIQTEYEQRGRGELFAALRPYLGGAGVSVSYSEIGGSLGISEGAVKLAAYRLRQEYGRRLRAEVAETVQDSADVDEELRYLIRVTAT